MSERPRAPEEISEIEASRTLNDAEAISETAKYKIDKDTKRARLEFTERQVNMAKDEMAEARGEELPSEIRKREQKQQEEEKEEKESALQIAREEEDLAKKEAEVRSELLTATPEEYRMRLFGEQNRLQEELSQLQKENPDLRASLRDWDGVSKEGFSELQKKATELRDEINARKDKMDILKKLRHQMKSGK